MSEASNAAPDRGLMLRHVELVFGGDYDGALDGLVELAWTDPATGALRHGQLFGTDKFEELTERAEALNRVEGCNVYLGAALRKPGTTRDRRASDAAFYSAPFAWADIDDNCVSAAVHAAKASGAPPTMTIVTGRHPYLRAQLWWRLAEAERDGAAIKALCASIGLALNGDSTVSNPSRVLRLGGSIAWPVKPGRAREATEVHIPQDGRPNSYYVAALAKSFAALAPLLNAAPKSPEQSAPPNAPPPNNPKPVELPIGSLSVEAMFAAIRSGQRWHDNVIRLVAHWIARGLSDVEVLAMASEITLPGFTADQTRRDLARMIDGGRRKWNVPNPTHAIHAIEDKAPPAPRAIRWRDGANAAMTPHRQWLIKGLALRRQLSVLVAPPGAGKSTLGIALAVAGATGRDDITGFHIAETVKCWVWNNEDDEDELDRRLIAVMTRWNVGPADLRHRFGLNSGSDNLLIVARAGKDGKVVRLPDIDAITGIVRAEGIGLLIVDPFIETHEVDENDNAQIKTVAAMWREVARRENCAVILVHHTSKPPSASPDSYAGSQYSARGASSLTGVARIVVTLFAMSEKDAEKFGVSPEERRLWVRMDDAKANLSLISGEPRWFRRVTVIIANGEAVGVLEPGDPKGDSAAGEDRSADIEAALFEAIQTAWDAGAPLSEQPRAKDRYAPGIVARALCCASEAVADVLARMMSGGAIERSLFCSKTKSYGLRIVPFNERGTAQTHQSAEDFE
jgi:hypothetical protein